MANARAIVPKLTLLRLRSLAIKARSHGNLELAALYYQLADDPIRAEKYRNLHNQGSKQ